jgi:hypothetical protein
MHPSDLGKDEPQLVIGPPAGSRLVGYGFVAVFGSAALVYSAGLIFCIDWPDTMRWWELAFIVGMPLAFAAVLASMARENQRPFILDRGRRVLLDHGRSVLSLDAVRAVAVRSDPGETCDFFAIDLVFENGRTFCLRRDWWPMDERESAALARAAPIAQYLGVELHNPSGGVAHQGQS